MSMVTAEYFYEQLFLIVQELPIKPPNCFKMFFMIFFSAQPRLDYSIQVSNLNRTEIIEALREEKGLFKEGVSEARLRNSLAVLRKKNHPLHDKVKLLSNDQLFQLCHSLSLDVPRREKAKMARLVVNHFFSNYPESPLTNLNRVMEEDTYFAELTGLYYF